MEQNILWQKVKHFKKILTNLYYSAIIIIEIKKGDMKNEDI